MKKFVVIVMTFLSLFFIFASCTSLEEKTQEVKEVLSTKEGASLYFESNSFSVYGVESNGDDMLFFYEHPYREIQPTRCFDFGSNGVLDSAYYDYPSNLVYTNISAKKYLFNDDSIPEIDLQVRQKAYELVINHILKNNKE